ncbi:MAG: SDR family oxidoreductase [Armatimonadota bacterium]|nr:SDR family oxidoreductase [Armatimonadota bacterium]
MQSAVYRDLRDRRVLVTGASSGIGAACARAFLLQGSRVALHHHTGSVAELAASFPDRGLPVRGDLSGEEGCIIVADAAAAALGGLDVLVCSAGIWEAAPVATIGADQLERMFRINLFSAFFFDP